MDRFLLQLAAVRNRSPDPMGRFALGREQLDQLAERFKTTIALDDPHYGTLYRHLLDLQSRYNLIYNQPHAVPRGQDWKGPILVEYGGRRFHLLDDYDPGVNRTLFFQLFSLSQGLTGFPERQSGIAFHVGAFGLPAKEENYFYALAPTSGVVKVIQVITGTPLSIAGAISVIIGQTSFATEAWQGAVPSGKLNPGPYLQNQQVVVPLAGLHQLDADDVAMADLNKKSPEELCHLYWVTLAELVKKHQALHPRITNMELYRGRYNFGWDYHNLIQRLKAIEQKLKDKTGSDDPSKACQGPHMEEAARLWKNRMPVEAELLYQCLIRICSGPPLPYEEFLDDLMAMFQRLMESGYTRPSIPKLIRLLELWRVAQGWFDTGPMFQNIYPYLFNFTEWLQTFIEVALYHPETALISLRAIYDEIVAYIQKLAAHLDNPANRYPDPWVFDRLLTAFRQRVDQLQGPIPGIGADELARLEQTWHQALARSAQNGRNGYFQRALDRWGGEAWSGGNYPQFSPADPGINSFESWLNQRCRP